MRILSILSLCDSHFCFLGAAWAFPTCLTETITAPPPPISKEWSKWGLCCFLNNILCRTKFPCANRRLLTWRIGKKLRVSAIYGHVIPVKQCSVAGGSSPRAGSRMGYGYVLRHLRLSYQCPAIKSLETAVYTAELPHCNHISITYFKNNTFREQYF